MYQFTLQPYKGPATRHKCPNCGKARRFSRYIDSETDNLLPEVYGKCDRINNCGYHLNPYKDGFANEVAKDQFRFNGQQEVVSKLTTSFIPEHLVQGSLKSYHQNNFVKQLSKRFGKIAMEVINLYGVGTSKHWPGATVFWQRDLTRMVRTGKIMLYREDELKRTNKITWAHAVLPMDNFQLSQCLFGEHLLANNSKMVGVVEAEKSAIIASIYLPQIQWVATGSENGLTMKRCKALEGRNVILFPDIGCYDNWSSKAKELTGVVSITTSDLLERNATNEETGLDLADYLLKFGPKDFQQGGRIDMPKDVHDVLQRMFSKNPFILEFVDRLDLELSKATVIKGPNPLHECA